jgi:hypothetical protein
MKWMNKQYSITSTNYLKKRWLPNVWVTSTQYSTLESLLANWIKPKKKTLAKFVKILDLNLYLYLLFYRLLLFIIIRLLWKTEERPKPITYEMQFKLLSPDYLQEATNFCLALFKKN